MIENRMIVESQWRWIASPNTPVDYLKMCDTDHDQPKRAVLEYNGERYCASCAREYGINLEEE